MLESRHICPHCQRDTNRARYLMQVDPDTQPLLSWPWALVLVAAGVVVCLALAQLVG